MKKQTTLSNIEKYLPEPAKYAFAAQISDLPGISDNIARIVVLYDYNIMHSQQRIVLEAEIIHINTKTNQNVTHQFNSKIKDWVVTNQFYTAVRDSNGNMILNPEYIKPEKRLPGVIYTPKQLQKYEIELAFDFFALGFKNFVGSNQDYFSSIILLGDEVNDLFDVYGSLSSKLMQMPPEKNLRPDLLKN